MKQGKKINRRIYNNIVKCFFRINLILIWNKSAALIRSQLSIL